jgi:glycosyltransferase involved in cell wall biosynthesis
MPTVSVCIPAYRQPAFLVRAVESVLTQDFVDFEIVITDDSPSSDVEEAIAAITDERIRYVRNARRLGSPGNWIAAAELSSSPLIKLLHHDDWLTRSDSLGRYVALLEDPGVDFGFSATQVVDADETPLWIHQPFARISEMRTDPLVLLLGNWVGAPSATIYRRSSSAHIDPRLCWVVDIDLYLSVLTTNQNFSYDVEPLVATTTGAEHQVTTNVQTDPNVALAEWFILSAKWASMRAWQGELLRYLGQLQIDYEAADWRRLWSLQLRGRAAALFVLAHVAERRSRETVE